MGYKNRDFMNNKSAKYSICHRTDSKLMKGRTFSQLACGTHCHKVSVSPKTLRDSTPNQIFVRTASIPQSLMGKMKGEFWKQYFHACRQKATFNVCVKNLPLGKRLYHDRLLQGFYTFLWYTWCLPLCTTRDQPRWIISLIQHGNSYDIITLPNFSMGYISFLEGFPPWLRLIKFIHLISRGSFIVFYFSLCFLIVAISLNSLPNSYMCSWHCRIHYPI